MSVASSGEGGQTSEKIEQQRVLFEQTWGQPDAPGIEQLLDEVLNEERSDLLRELLYVEFEFLQRKNSELSLEQYLSRFPEYAAIVHEVADAIGQYTVFKRRNIVGYTLLNELERGGMGIVYKAKSDLLNNFVALKVVNQRLVSNPEALSRFTRELEMIGRLKHPNIVEAKHAGITEDGTPYLVMEFVEGMTLAQWGKQNPPSGSGGTHEPNSTFLLENSSTETSEQKKSNGKGLSKADQIAKACDIIRAAARGLQAIHEAGLVHRDIKPGNVMLLPDGQVKILDLGLAKLREHIAGHTSAYTGLAPNGQTQEGQFLGSPGYVAPEQMHSATDVDIRADIYSLGCTFFYLLYGRTPSERSMDEMPVSFPPKIRGILDKMLAADPASRFQEPREVADALDSFLGRKQQAHWGWTFAATAVFFAMLFGIVWWSAHVSPPPRDNTVIVDPEEKQNSPPSPSPSTEFISLDKTEQIRSALQEAVDFRYRGNSEEAEDRLRKLESDLREDPFEGSGDILAEVLWALGDCLFFGGFASDSLTERRVQRMTDWYDEAWKLATNLPDEFRMKLLCKRAVVNNTIDMIANGENSSLYHRFAKAVISENEQSILSFVDLFEWSVENELENDFLTREALDLRLFALERLISRAVNNNGGEKLSRALRTLDKILLKPYPDKDSSVYLHRFFDWAIRAKDPTDYSQLIEYLFRMREGAERLSFPQGSRLILFYFSPWSDENGFAVYFPTNEQEPQRFELPFNRVLIKEAIRKEEPLALDEGLASLIRQDINAGIPIVLSWDDTACWTLRRDALTNEDWCFDKSFTIEEIMGRMK